MNVSVQLIFQNYNGTVDDATHVAHESRIALQAEALGFDKIFAVEHHFFDYAACPDNAQYLSWLAAKTSRVKLASGAFILPWNNPLRVAEKIALLDHLSDGRAVLGLGRGLARREYAGFGIDMAESRERFDEAADMILKALDTGYIEGNGKYYPQARVDIRPRPLRGFRDRLYAIGMSVESIEQAARIGARLAVFSQMPWEMWRAMNYAAYEKVWAEHHQTPPPGPITCDIMYCSESNDEAEAVARKHMVEYYVSVMDHYEMLGSHFTGVRGYELYAQASEILSQIGKEDQAEGYLHVQSWGAPQRILEKLRKRWDAIGPFELSVVARYGTLPIDKAEASIKHFAKHVLPEFQSWKA